MTKKHISWYRGEGKDLTFTVYGDLTARALSFAVKRYQENDSPRVVNKLNAVAGGSGITASYDADTDLTTITISIDPDDTFALGLRTYYYDLISVASGDFTDRVGLYYGEFNLIFSVQHPDDSTSVPTVGYLDQAFDKRAIYKVESDAVITELTDEGFNTTMTASRVGLGVFRLTSSEAIFTGNVQHQVDVINTNTNLFIIPNVVRVSSTILEVQFIDFNSRMVIDTDFLIDIKRVKQ